MKYPISPLIQRTSHELQLEVSNSPFYASEGIELRKQIDATDTLVCIGYIYGPHEIEIYRRTESKRESFFRDKLWFLYGWFIKPRPRNEGYEVLQKLPSSEFNDTLFVNIVKKELDEVR